MQLSIESFFKTKEAASRGDEVLFDKKEKPNKTSSVRFSQQQAKKRKDAPPALLNSPILSPSPPSRENIVAQSATTAFPSPESCGDESTSITCDTINKISEEEKQELTLPKMNSCQPSSKMVVEREVEATLTEYERVRQENIQRNQRFLQELGLSSLKDVMHAPVSTDIPTIEKKRKTKNVPFIKTDVLPRRVQPRRGVKNGRHTRDISPKKIEKETESVVDAEEYFEYNDSAVLQYVLTDQCDFDTNDVMVDDRTPSSRLFPIRTVASSAVENSSQLGSDVILQCADLPAVYSMNFHHKSRLLVAGGKGGNVALFALPDYDLRGVAVGNLESMPQAHSDGDVTVFEPLLTFRAHQRWVSCAKFLSHNESCANYSGINILTAADDGLVKLWDAAQTSKSKHHEMSNSIAKLQSMSTCGHAPGRGIFSLDECKMEILTGSKDRSVCVSRVTGVGDITPLHKFSELHDNVVKSVSWQCPAATIFASGSQDRSVCIKDTRNGYDGRADVEVADAHGGGVHTVQWCPHTMGEHFLLSAGYDDLINVYDVRNSGNERASPVYSFREHRAPSSIKKRRTITTPCFLSNSCVLIPSEYSGALSIHCLLTGNAISRGSLTDDTVPISVSTMPDGKGSSKFIVAASNKKGSMHVLRCT